MAENNIPYDKLELFREKLELSKEEFVEINPYREVFASKSKEFADYLYGVFAGIPETRIIMERMDDPARLRKFWAMWFERLFRSELDDDFMAFLWKIGIRHVGVGLDQRFSNLGFSVVRQFCREAIGSEVPSEAQFAVSATVDKLIDYCLLVETSAYISATTRCDIELIKGIADRVRNKITVIGGYARMLQRKISPGEPSYEIYESLIAESAMCERMVEDINAYNDVFQRDPDFREVSLGEVIDKAVERLKPGEKFPGVRFEVAFKPGSELACADPRDLQELFYYTLENAFEWAGGETPHVRISSSGECPPEHFVCVEVFNSGIPPRKENVEKFFSLFYTTKPMGSGFGVPISALAARKNFGKLAIEPEEGGTRVIVALPSSIQDTGQSRP